jgi:hypothetical protein
MKKSVLIFALATLGTTAFAQDKAVVTKGGKPVSVALATPLAQPSATSTVSSQAPLDAPATKSVPLKSKEATLVQRKEK